MKILTGDWTEYLGYLDPNVFKLDNNSSINRLVIGKDTNNNFNTYSVVRDSLKGYPLTFMPYLIDLRNHHEFKQKELLVKADINTPTIYFSKSSYGYLTVLPGDNDTYYVMSLCGTTRGIGKFLITKQKIIELISELNYISKPESESDLDKIKHNIFESKVLKWSGRPNTDDRESYDTIVDEFICGLIYGNDKYVYFQEYEGVDPNQAKDEILEFRIHLFRDKHKTNYIGKVRSIVPFIKLDQSQDITFYSGIETYIGYTNTVLNVAVYENLRVFIREKLIPFFNTQLDYPFCAFDVYYNKLTSSFGVFEYSPTPHISFDSNRNLVEEKHGKKTGLVSKGWYELLSEYATTALETYIKQKFN